MNLIDQREAQIPYSHLNFALAKDFVFRMWCDLALERQIAAPDDLSGACKYGSLFVSQVFGGSIEGHYAHQFNRIGGRIIDLSHDARDVGLMHNPYLHDPEYFAIAEYQARLLLCLPRAERWAEDFMREMRT
jgi:hypothetical protein